MTDLQRPRNGTTGKRYRSYGERRTASFSITLTPTDYRHLQMFCDEHGVTKSTVIENALREYILERRAT